MRAKVSKKLTALFLAGAVWLGLSAIAGTTVHAADSPVMKAGDQVKMGVTDESYDGVPEWFVLDTVDTNNDGTPDQAYLMSKYLWRNKGSAELQFNSKQNNKWDASNAKVWCNTFYQKVLKSSNLVATTDISDPAGNNILAMESKGNKVFLPSLAEMSDVKYFKDNAARAAALPAGTTSSAYSDKGEYWTRTPMATNNRVGKISNMGIVGNQAPLANNGVYIRPVFYLDLNSNACAQRQETGDGESKVVTWTYDVENSAHAYSAPTYTWSEDNATCTAVATCEKCKDELKETVNTTKEVKEPTEEAEGNTKYTAAFKSEVFTTQEKNVPIAKLEHVHAYGQPTYTWSEDNATCTAVATCDKCKDELKETVNTTKEVKEPTEEAEGNTKYTATFKSEVFTTQEKNIPIAKLEKPEEPVKPAVKPAVNTVKVGGKYTVSGASYQVLSVKKATVSLVKAKNAKRVSVPATVKISGKNYKVVQLNGKAFTAKKIRTVTVGKNVTKISKNAFTKSKATKVVLKTKKLKKSSVKGCMKSSKVKTVQVKVGTKKQNKKLVKTYKKAFTKKNCGKKVKVK